MTLAYTVLAAATYPARLAVAASRTVLALGELSSPDGPVLRNGGYADRLAAPGGLLETLVAPGGLADRVLSDDGYAEKLLASGGTLDQLVALGGTLEDIRPRLTELAELIPSLHEAVDKLGRSVGPLGELAGRFPGGRKKTPAGQGTVTT